jgi:FkbM family methyltransferase
MSTYFSQYLQDQFVDEVVLNRKRNGFFLDIGAHDGISYSNSYFFEKYRAFNGICVEPNPTVFAKLKANRNTTCMNVCIGQPDGMVKFLVIEGYGEMLSGVLDSYAPEHMERINKVIEQEGGAKKEIEVPSTPLQNIELLVGVEVDYCSIDTEGHEYSVLKSIDFDKVKIKCFTVENNYADNKVAHLLESKGYVKIFTIGDDDVFVLRDKYDSGIKFRLFLYRLKRKIKTLLK